MDAAQPNHGCDPITILVQLCKSRVARLAQIHLHAVDGCTDILKRNTKTLDRLIEGGVQRMTVPPEQAGVGRLSPVCECRCFLWERTRTVREIIG